MRILLYFGMLLGLSASAASTKDIARQWGQYQRQLFICARGTAILRAKLQCENEAAGGVEECISRCQHDMKVRLQKCKAFTNTKPRPMGAGQEKQPRPQPESMTRMFGEDRGSAGQ